jgi:hypothetical protein
VWVDREVCDVKLHFELLGDLPTILRAATPEMFSAKYSAHCDYTAI